MGKTKTAVLESVLLCVLVLLCLTLQLNDMIDLSTTLIISALGVIYIGFGIFKR
jgi:hypothetical protein